MNNTVTLRVSGREWGGWTSVKISAGIERLARDFNVQITRQWPGETGSVPLQPRIKNGDAVEVLIGDDPVTEKPQDASEAISDDRGTNVADVHGFGDVGRAEIDDDCSRLRNRWYTQALITRGSRDLPGNEPRCQTEVDEARARDSRWLAHVRKLEVGDDFLGQRTWIQA